MRTRNSYQQGRTKQKFNILCRWVLCHFAHDKLTNAENSLGKHATNWTSTEMLNYHWQIKSVADCVCCSLKCTLGQNDFKLGQNILN